MKDKIRFAAVIITGLLSGIFILLPANEFVSYYEYNSQHSVTAGQFIYTQFIRAVTLETPLKLVFYLLLGGLAGTASLISLLSFRKRNFLIYQLRNELEKSIPALIENGEDDTVEFKSSFRWDYNQQKPNKILEGVIIKTLAGFMNTRSGGSLLIGVADNGSILGLENDYNTLKRKDRDGFTQLLTSTVSEKIGTHACRLIRILFHQKDGKDVCRIIILPSPVPVYVSDEGQSKFFVRTASGTREMDVQEAITFIKARWD